MRAGELDRRVTIEQPTASQDTFGEFVPAWAILDTVWARFEPLNGRELLAAQGINAELNAKFTIRFRDDITTQMRVQNEDGATYGIQAIVEQGRREGLALFVKAFV